MNTKGIKFLAVLAVLAMAFAAFAVITDVEEDDAAIAHSAKWTAETQGPLDFAAALTPDAGPAAGKNYTNATVLKSNIAVSFDADTKTYTVTGTLYKQDIEDTTTAFYSLWEQNTEYFYGLGYMITVTEAGHLALTGGDIDGAADFAGAGSEDVLIYIKSAGVRYATFTPTSDPTHPVTYTIDFSGVTLSDTKVADADPGYVALANANALAGGVSGTDGADGKWTYADGILTLTNYDGNEVFESATLKQVTLSGENRIEANATYAIKSILGSPVTIKPVEGQGDLDIVLSSAAALTAISGANTLNIQATSLTISIPEAGANSFGIAATTVNIYESELDITMDSTKTNTGISATTLDIKSCAAISINANKGIAATNMDVAASAVGITSAIGGIVLAQDLSVMKNSIIEADASITLPEVIGPVYGIKARAVSAESDSYIVADKMRFTAGTNNASIEVVGDVVLAAGTGFTNKGDLEIGGDFLIMGTFDNQGVAEIEGKTILMKADEVVVVDAGEPPTADPLNALVFSTTPGTGATYYVMHIDIDTYEVSSATTAYVTGVLGLSLDNATAVTKNANFKGIATVDEDGKIANIEITINTVDTSGEQRVPCVASVPLTFVKDTTTPANNGYFIAAAGDVVPTGDAAKVTLTNSKCTGGAVVKVAVVGVTSTPVFGVSDGAYTATGGVFAYYHQAALVSGGVLTGDVTIDSDAVATVITGGLLAGDITTKNDVTIGADGSIAGDITIKADALTITMAGSMLGNIISSDKTTTAIIISGEMAGEISINGKYKSTAGAATADTDYNAAVALLTSKGTATTFVTTKADGTTPGFISSAFDFGAPEKEGETSSVFVSEGTFKLTASLVIPAAVDLTVESGATLEVASVASITINGAIKAEEGSTVNIYDADKKIYTYGKLSNELTFFVEPYTYYCSFTYALVNAPEGTVLDVTKDVTVNANATVKKDVTILVGENRTITFNADKILSMGEGATFVLSDGAKVVFNARTAATKVDSGVFLYDDNEITVKSAYFKTANATISAVKATTTEPAKLSFVGTLAAGEIEFSEGIFVGTVTYETLGAGTVADPFTSGTATIAEDAIFMGTYNKDAQGKAKFVIEGTWGVTAAKTIDIPLSGDGNIELGDGVALTINKGYAAAAADRVKQSLNVTYGDNAVCLEKVIVGDADVDTNMVITAVKATTTVPEYMKIEGSTPATGVAFFSGTVYIEGAVNLGKAYLDADAKFDVPADATLTLIKDTATVAVGLLSVAGTFNFNLADDTTKTYGVLDSQISYVDGGETVYAALATAITEGGVTEFTVSSNIEMAGGTEANPKDLGNVTLEVAEGKKLTVTGYVTIGTASTALGSGYGVDGNIVLADHAVLIVYDNATIDADSVFTNAAMTVKAKMSQFIVDYNDALYATVYNDGTVLLTNVEKSMNPSFDGYKFTGYSNYVPLPAAEQVVGATDVAIMLEAGKVSVVLAKVDGMTYYVNNVAYKQMGVPVELKVGDVVSASVNSGYTGTAKVNGQDYIIVDAATKTVTATGAQPVPPEPTPEPSSNDFGITEILLIVLVIMIAVLIVVMVLRLNRS